MFHAGPSHLKEYHTVVQIDQIRFTFDCRSYYLQALLAWCSHNLQSKRYPNTLVWRLVPGEASVLRLFSLIYILQMFEACVRSRKHILLSEWNNKVVHFREQIRAPYYNRLYFLLLQAKRPKDIFPSGRHYCSVHSVVNGSLISSCSARSISKATNCLVVLRTRWDALFIGNTTFPTILKRCFTVAIRVKYLLHVWTNFSNMAEDAARCFLYFPNLSLSSTYMKAFVLEVTNTSVLMHFL